MRVSWLVATVLTLPTALALAAEASPVAAAVADRTAGRFEQSATTLLAWLAQHADDARALHELGVLYALTSQYREAETRLQAALAVAPGQVESRRALAELWRAQARCLDALPLYDALVVRDGQDATGWRGRLLCHEQLGQTDAALQTAAEIQAKLAGSPLVAWATARAVQVRAMSAQGGFTPQQADAEGQALFGQQRFVEAAVWLAKAHELQPTADRAYRLAMARLGTGDPLAAQVALEQALQLDPRHLASLSAWPTVAKALRLQGQGGADVDLQHLEGGWLPAVARALREGNATLARRLVDAAKAAPAEGKGVVLMVLDAELKLRENKLGEAEKLFRDVLVARPNYPPAKKGLAAVLALMRRDFEAREMAGLKSADERDDLERLVPLRRAELMHQLAMAVDPAVAPLPSLVDQVIDSKPAPPPPPPPPMEPAPPAPPPPPPPPPAKKGGKGKKK
jgi:predicted Zn-dependent protease